MAFLLNKFCSRLAVYLGNYVILLLFSPSGPFHLALWEDSLVIFLTHSGGKLLCQTHFRHSTGSVLPVWLFLITFSLCHLLTLSSHSRCISLLHWHAHVPPGGDWQRQMISMMHTSSNCSWHTHTLARAHKWGTCSIRKRYFLVHIGWMVCQQCQEIEINKKTQSPLCSHWCLHSVSMNVNGWAQCAYQASDFSHLF